MAPARARWLAALVVLAAWALLQQAAPAAAIPGARRRVPPKAPAAQGGRFTAQAGPQAPSVGRLVRLPDTPCLPRPSTGGPPAGPARRPGDSSFAGVPETAAAAAGGPDGPSDFLQPGQAFSIEGLPSASGVPEGPPAAGRLLLALKGLNHYDHTHAGVGQGANEPPDQGLCAGKGYVMETVNTVMRVFSAADGKPLTAPTPLNDFLGLPPAFDPNTTKTGPEVFDPSCFFEPRSKRFIHVAGYVGKKPDGSGGDGTMYTMVSVSSTSNPAKAWHHWRVDGARMTDCSGGPCCVNGPCLADYPQAMVSANAIVISTNEFDLNGNNYYGNNIYVIPLQPLLANDPSKTTLIYWARVSGTNSYHVLPAVRPANMPYKLYADSIHLVGTGYMDTNTSDYLQLYTIQNITLALSKLSTLPGSASGVHLTIGTIPVNQYYLDGDHSPSYAPQSKPFAPNEAPLLSCVRNAASIPACASAVDPSQKNASAVIPYLDAGGLRLNSLAIGGGGELWALQGRMVTVNGKQVTGVAWFILDPTSKTRLAEGTLAVAGAHLLYPSVAISSTGSGAGYIGFSIVGDAHFPSAGYVAVNANGPYGNAVISGEGVAPQDGFSGYPTIVNTGFPLSRWGDYGAAAVEEKGTVWLANEYIGDRCTLDSWLQGNYTCGGARAMSANWGTFITKLAPAKPL